MTTSLSELQHRASIVEAYVEGAQIQRCIHKFVDKPNARWSNCDPGKRNWNWDKYMYRVKP